jgi:hypothetical protein
LRKTGGGEGDAGEEGKAELLLDDTERNATGREEVRKMKARKVRRSYY